MIVVARRERKGDARRELERDRSSRKKSEHLLAETLQTKFTTVKTTIY
jgi:hypothetical protein